MDRRAWLPYLLDGVPVFARQHKTQFYTIEDDYLGVVIIQIGDYEVRARGRVWRMRRTEFEERAIPMQEAA
jgi:hypothetical protein